LAGASLPGEDLVGGGAKERSYSVHAPYDLVERGFDHRVVPQQPAFGTQALEHTLPGGHMDRHPIGALAVVEVVWHREAATSLHQAYSTAGGIQPGDAAGDFRIDTGDNSSDGEHDSSDPGTGPAARSAHPGFVTRRRNTHLYGVLDLCSPELPEPGARDLHCA